MSARPACPRCARPLARGCVCGLVVPVDNRVEVLLLQHPMEAREAKGTGRLLAASLARCRVEVGEVFDPVALAGWLGAVGESVLLYPETSGDGDRDDVGDSAPVAAATGSAVRRLVVLDATWRKSVRMLHSNPALAALPRLALADEGDDATDAASDVNAYAALRRARRPLRQRSTLEATCRGLAALEGDATRYAPLRDLLPRFVSWSLALRGG